MKAPSAQGTAGTRLGEGPQAGPQHKAINLLQLTQVRQLESMNNFKSTAKILHLGQMVQTKMCSQV